MSLPGVLLLTDGAQAAAAGHDLSVLLAAAVAAGARGIVLRERQLPPSRRQELAQRLRALLDDVGGLLVVASPFPSSSQPSADGVHLRAGEPLPTPRPGVVGRSCHDHAELRAAAHDGCDYATLSPIFATDSKPGYGPALGLDSLRDAPLPVFALGGVTAGNAAACRAAGATGVAVMGAVMRAADPAGAVADLLTAIEEAP